MNLVYFLIGFSIFAVPVVLISWLLGISPWLLIGGLLFLFFLYQFTTLPDHRTRYTK